jgi:ribosome-associated protein
MQISRTEQKRRIKAIEQLVTELVRLAPKKLDQTALDEECKEMLRETAALQGAVKQRQIKHLTKVIQEYPLEPLYELVDQQHGKHLAAQQQVHNLELYRDALIEEALEHQHICRQNNMDWEENWSCATLTELIQILPALDSLTLSRLASLFARTRNPRYSREIFRHLRSTLETQQRNSKLS